MSRLGYLILAAVMLALGWYAFWPRSDPDARQPFWRESIPPRFTLVLPEYRQEWVSQGKNPRVLIGDLDRPGDYTAMQAWWQPIRRLRAPIVARDLTPAERTAYGLSDDRQVRLPDGRSISWGTRDGQSWLYRKDRDGGVLVAAGRQLADRLTRLGRRLDQQEILPQNLSGLNAITIDGNEFYWTDLDWHHGDNNRPPVTSRLQALTSELQQLRVQRLAGPLAGPMYGVVRHRIILIGDQTWDLQLVWHHDGSQPGIAGIQWGMILNHGLLQPIDAATGQQLSTAITDLQRDMPFDLRLTFMASLVEEAEIYRDGQPWFRIERNDFYDELDGQSTWRMEVDNRIFVAAADSGQRFEAAFNNIVLGGSQYAVQPRSWAPPPQGVAIQLFGKQLPPPAWLYLPDQQTVITARYQGEAEEVPPLLRELQPDLFLDRWLCQKTIARFNKVQRRWHDSNHIETLSRSDGRWLLRQGQVDQQPPPGEHLDGRVAERWLTALHHTQAAEVRLVPGSDWVRSLGPPVFDLAVRLEPLDARVDQQLVRLEDTMTMAWSWTWYRQDDQWWAIDLSGQRAYRVIDDDARQLMADLSQRPLLPLVTAAIHGVEYRDRTGTSWRLRRNPDTTGLVGIASQRGSWQLWRAGDGGWQLADQAAVETYLQQIVSWEVSDQPLPPERSQLPLAYRPASKEQEATWINDAQAEIVFISGDLEMPQRFTITLGPQNDEISLALPLSVDRSIPLRQRIAASHRSAQRPAAYFLPLAPATPATPTEQP